MKTADFDIEKIVKRGAITNELDYERALIADRKLRILSKENRHFKNVRNNLRDLIEQYESLEWDDLESITDEKVIESNKFEKITEMERVFIEARKSEIKNKLKELNLTQQDLAKILGHKSKTHMSELMNGIKPFTLRDLIIINRIFKVNMNKLLPLFLSNDDQIKLKEAVKSIKSPNLKLKSDDLILC